MSPIVRVLALAAALSPIAFGGATAQDTFRWKKVGGWDIRIDKTVDYGCFMLGAYNRGDIVRVGIDQKHLNGYVILGNPKWRSLEVGKQYELKLKFERSHSWRGVATAIKLGNGQYTFLRLRFAKPGFLSDLARNQSLTIRYNNKLVSKLNLDGTYAAVRELAHCQNVVETVRRRAASGDPFAADQAKKNPSAGTVPGADPFK